jgi:leader peptidase (prepilin peptidase)/N-methyltransferase
MSGADIAISVLPAAGAVAAIGATRAAAGLRILHRSINPDAPVFTAAAIAWAVGVPLVLVAASDQAWLFPAAVFAWGGLALALADLMALRAPKTWSSLYGLAGLACALASAPASALAAALTAGAAWGLLAMARRAFVRARGREGLGGGDALVFAALAAWSGPVAAPWVLGLGGVFALTIGIARSRAARGAARVPLAACLVAASVVVAMLSALVWGSPFWASPP